MIRGLLEASLGDVAYLSFCRLQAVPLRVGHVHVKLEELAAVLFAVAFGFSAVVPTAVPLLYGHMWAGLGTVLAIMVILPGLSCIWALNENAYQAIGRPDIWTKIAGFSLLGLLPLGDDALVGMNCLILWAVAKEVGG